MKPLVFLTVRSTFNGIRRAFTSPQRLIGLIFVLVYYFQFIFRAMLMPPGSSSAFPSTLSFEIPPIRTIEAIVFGLFSFLSLILMLGSLTPRGGFRQADVDVLFATPLSPRLVLIFRIARDYLITLILPLLFTLMGPGARTGYQFFYKTLPAQSRFVGLGLTCSWFLLALMWVCLGYGISMFVNRSDPQSERNAKIINWSFAAVFVISILYIGLRLRADPEVNNLISIASSLLVRTVFFGATFASMIVMGIYKGSALSLITGSLLLLSMSGLGIGLALTQVGYMYDQAAARGFGTANLRKLQRSGDTYGMLAEQARQGKIRTGKIAGRISKLRTRGGGALVWKELLLQTRGAMIQYYIFVPLILTIVLGPIYSISKRGPSEVEGWILLGTESLGVFMITLNNATSGYIELLRRVDFQKPLPLSPTTTVFWEIVAKVVPTCLLVFLAALGSIIIDPTLWAVSVGSMLLMPSLSLVLSSVVLLVTILFPDVEDATQRSFRGLMILLGSVISCTLGGLLTLLLYGVLHLNLILVAVPVVAINIGITIGICALAGTLYAQFNPSE
jgi:hypothetical protein